MATLASPVLAQAPAADRRIDVTVLDEQGLAVVGGRVTATLRDHRSGSMETVRAGYLVGCDGFASTVRDLLEAGNAGASISPSP